MQQSKSNSDNVLYGTKLPQAAPVNKNNKPHKKTSVFDNKIDYPPDYLGVTVTKLVNNLLADAVGYQNYRVTKKSAGYDDKDVNELNKMTKKVEFQRKDQTFNVRDSVSVIVFLQSSRVACYACSIPKGAAMWLFKQYISGLVKSVIQGRVALPTETIRSQEGCLKSYSVIVNYLLQRDATEDNISVVDADV